MQSSHQRLMMFSQNEVTPAPIRPKDDACRCQVLLQHLESSLKSKPLQHLVCSQLATFAADSRQFASYCRPS